MNPEKKEHHEFMESLRQIVSKSSDRGNSKRLPLSSLEDDNEFLKWLGLIDEAPSDDGSG